MPSDNFPAARSIPGSPPQPWLIFCNVIDNFGDIGVCWRLARQLAGEHGVAVILYVDDWAATLGFLQQCYVDGQASDLVILQGVQLRRWHDGVDWRNVVEDADLVIEAFACTLPAGVIQAMAARPQPPLWINLEYLSAESWVIDCHARASLQSVAGESTGGGTRVLTKWFYFPGFSPDTGGLLREHDLLARHARWQAELASSRRQVLQDLGLAYPDPGDQQSALMVSLFAYDRPEDTALTSWFAAMAEGSGMTLCLVPQGKILNSVARALALEHTPIAGEVVVSGALTVAVIPFLPMDEYDRLLSICDLNLVRGEDSFVRAQWAARPMIWHIYAQENDAHLNKLEAFLGLYCPDSKPGSAQAVLAEFIRFWNQGADCRKVWHDLRPQLPELTQSARNWQQKLAGLPDLAGSLMRFYRNQP